MMNHREIPVSSIEVAESPFVRWRAVLGMDGLAPPDVLIGSIDELGVLAPIAVFDLGNGSYHLVCGIARYKAAQSLGMGRIDCVVFDGKTDHLSLF